MIAKPMRTLVRDWTGSLHSKHFLTRGEQREHVATCPHGPNRVSRLVSEQTMQSSNDSCSGGTRFPTPALAPLHQTHASVITCENKHQTFIHRYAQHLHTRVRQMTIRVKYSTGIELNSRYRPTRVVPDQRPLNGRCCPVRIAALQYMYRTTVVLTVLVLLQSFNTKHSWNTEWPMNVSYNWVGLFRSV